MLAASAVKYAGRKTSPSVQMAPAAYRMTTTQAQAFYAADDAVLNVPDGVWSEIRLVWTVRATYSANQLFERVADFWNDHFIMDMDQDKTDRVRRWFPAHDRIIRDNALGNFGAMLLAVAQSPVMMTDLDLAVSSAPQPNENYAREVMELHTLGIASYLGPTTPAGAAGTGYSDADVTAAAAVLSGWRFDENGVFAFAPKKHLGAPAAALGQSFPAKGAAAGEQLLAYLAAHPNTARFVAGKLYLRFVADAVPAGSTLLPAMAAAFAAHAASPNQIALVLSVMATHPEFLASAGGKLKTPRHLVVSALRASGADFELVPQALSAISQFGAVGLRLPGARRAADRRRLLRRRERHADAVGAGGAAARPVRGGGPAPRLAARRRPPGRARRRAGRPSRPAGRSSGPSRRAPGGHFARSSRVGRLARGGAGIRGLVRGRLRQDAGRARRAAPRRAVPRRRRGDGHARVPGLLSPAGARRLPRPGRRVCARSSSGSTRPW